MKNFKKLSIVLVMVGFLNTLYCLPSFAAENVKATDKTTNQSIPKDKPEMTIGEAELLLKSLLVKTNGVSSIDSDHFGDTLEAFLESNSSSYTNKPYYDDMRAFASTYLIYLDNQNDQTNDGDLPQAIKETTISEIRQENLSKNKLDNAVAANIPTIKIESASSFTYSTSAAKNYIEKWWDGRNPIYESMPGDDCTNFASQVVHAGGYSFANGWYMEQTSNINWKWSHSWTVVQDFFNYWTSTRGHTYRDFSGHGGIASYADVGDILQFYDQVGAKGWYHTAVISKISGGNVYYAAHSDNHEYKNLDEVSGYKDDFRIIKF